MRRYFPDIFHITLLTAVVAVFFYQVILSGKLPVPTDTLVGLYHPWRDFYASTNPRGVPFKNFLITDPVRQQIPWRKIAIDQWKEGKIPWWNPYAFSGTTLAGNIQAGVFYPLNFIFFFFSFSTAWTILIVLQPMLAGLFLYLYLRSNGIQPTAALVGGISWSYSGFSIAWLTWGTIVQTALWIPLALVAMNKLLSGRNVWWICLAFAWTMQLLAGHMQIAFYGFVFSIIYWFVQIHNYKKNILHKFKYLVLSLCVFVFITAIQWVPFLESFMNSARLVETNIDAPGFFLPWLHLVQFIVPDFFGNPATLNYWGQWNWAELVGYVGIIPMILAICIMTFSKKEYRFWTWSIFVCLIFALPNPIAKLPYLFHIPILSSFQPTRLMVLVDLSLAVLSAYGAQAFLKNNIKFMKSFFFIGGVLAIGWLAGLWIINFGKDPVVVSNFTVTLRNLTLPTVIFFTAILLFFVGVRQLKKSIYITAFLVLLTILDLLRFGWKFTPFTSSEYFFPETRVITYLKNQTKPFRIMSIDDRILPSNAASYFGLETIEGYDPVYSARYEQFLAAASRGNSNINPPYGFNRILSIKNIDSPLLPFFNVQYILSLNDIDRPYLKKVMQEGETRVYKNTLLFPRIYLSEKTIQSTDAQKTIQKLIEVNTSKIATYETPMLDILTTPLTLSEGVTIEKYSTYEIVFNTMSRNPRLVVILNKYDRHWDARIDNNTRGKLVPVNYSFSGLMVPAGTHRVVLTYSGKLF